MHGYQHNSEIKKLSAMSTPWQLSKALPNDYHLNKNSSINFHQHSQKNKITVPWLQIPDTITEYVTSGRPCHLIPGMQCIALDLSSLSKREFRPDLT